MNTRMYSVRIDGALMEDIELYLLDPPTRGLKKKNGKRRDLSDLIRQGLRQLIQARIRQQRYQGRQKPRERPAPLNISDDADVTSSAPAE
jgi:hypothetical protein